MSLLCCVVSVRKQIFHCQKNSLSPTLTRTHPTNHPPPAILYSVPKVRPRTRVLPEIDGAIVFESDVEYTYCLHCAKRYSTNQLILAVRLSPENTIWWHATNCLPHLRPWQPEPCPYRLCDGTGTQPVLYLGDNPLCFCTRYPNPKK